MLVPLTDPEHPLAKQMILLIGAHSHLPRTIEATAVEPAPVGEAVDPQPQRRGRTLVTGVLTRAGVAAPAI